VSNVSTTRKMNGSFIREFRISSQAIQGLSKKTPNFSYILLPNYKVNIIVFGVSEFNNVRRLCDGPGANIMKQQ
jgi:hypothetical protein